MPESDLIACILSCICAGNPVGGAKRVALSLLPAAVRRALCAVAAG